MKTSIIITLTIAIVAATTISFRRSETIKVKTENGEGIKFFAGSWNEVLAKSKAENKPIFLDIYATWCGPCKMLKRKTFTDKLSGDYFNANFINVEFDGEKGDGLMLAKKFNLTAYPSLFLVNSNGAIISSSEGYMSPAQLVDFGKKGLAKNK